MREFETVAGSGVQGMRPTDWYKWYAALDEGIRIETSSLQQQCGSMEYLGKTGYLDCCRWHSQRNYGNFGCRKTFFCQRCTDDAAKVRGGDADW